MTHRIQFTAPGGPEVLQWVEADLPDPGPGEARLRHTAIGVNYIDVYHRSGAYPVPLPAVPGFEAAGVVEALGPGVTGLAVGQRVAYVDGPTGAYSEARNHPADRLVPLPASLSDEVAAALLFKGLTAHMLVRRVWRAGAEPWVLVHAAAGGVGLILTRWLAHEGGRVIGVVGSEEKATAVRAEGAEAVVVVPRGAAYDQLAAEVRRITGGRGVGTVFDSVGRDTFEASLDSLAPFGLLASFGRSSGPVPPVNSEELGRRGSLAFQRPSIIGHIAKADPAILRADIAEVFAAQTQGIIRAHIHGTLPLREAAQAHALLESRATRGALVLLP
ncbi:quinone oxidoreductase family protein [Geothrix terrae]|uniref:quinone oxidoreductase family protein n=1 Tax=Geothrix terrae TaxID=2922720 RepID=UPI001FAC8368|nr:quinone oxidoreductase [Geothrix terrae]